ncbi:MAG: hypothetical protein QOE30_5521 [Mycobacterium sp.]|jgi:NAD/NADP transhydrogenase beta subunit|uniref:hypothetical protein n=1 Tax=Mycobacterium sp. TaxID=1785 RepID=UPI0028B45516|nr:hypothetical protein [Mycobacterium sp.]MDT5119782.1 hypothetical protein [Mycobacterium sp.]
MFNVEQPGSGADERSGSLAPVVLSVLSAYAGLSSGLAGFVLERTALVIGGIVLIASASVLVRWPGSKRTRKGD